MRKPLVAPLLLSAIALAAGCGGGGSGGGLPPTGGAGSGAAGSANSAVVITIPPKPTDALGKTPAYVSPNTASIGIVVTPQGGTAYPAVIANVPGTSCTAASGGGYTCTITVTATYGVDTVTITAYSAANAGGNILSSGSITSTFSATASPSPALNAVLTGVVKNIGLSIVHGTVMDRYVPVGQSATLNVVGRDASGAVIVGTYDTPITVSLPANSGLSLASTTFVDSTHTTSQISYLGGPTYYTAPTSVLTITATAGATTATTVFDPTSTSLQFAAGDGQPNGAIATNVIRYGSKLAFVMRGFEDGGELGTIDPATGAQTVAPSIGFLPYGVLYEDPTYHGLWVGTVDDSDTGILNCFTSPSATAVPIALPTAGLTNPIDLTLDHSNNLWFTNANTLLGRVKLTGQCQTDGNQAVYTNVPDDNENPTYLSGIVTDATTDQIWTGDDDNPEYFSANASSPPPPAGYDLAHSADGMYDMTVDSSGNILATVDYDPSFIATMPAGTEHFSTFVDLPSTTDPSMITTQPTGSLIAFGDEDYGGVGVYSPSDPTHLAVLGLPAATAGCYSVAFDNAGAPWAFCEVTSDSRVTHSSAGTQTSGSISAALFRVVLTDAWNVFITTTGLPQGERENAGIGGGPSNLTFTVACTGSVTCRMATGFPREVCITAGAPGAGTMTVTGSDGRSVETDFSSYEHVTTGPRRPAFARDRRPAGAHRRTP